ncbi:MAG: hypothetical protein IT324_25280 [Anaerolineae bacterium]|nr:hypothetical protein [Anaerolineae bacterium]
MKTQSVRLLCTVLIGTVLVLLMVPQPGAASSQIQPGYIVANAAQQNTCQAILSHAIETLNNTCDKLDRNNACYGNNAVEAELNSTTIKFNTLGDRAPIRMIKRLVTSPLDMEKGTWGLSLLKLQANLPDTMPGQNVLFLVYGNTTIENASGNMQAFYFTSGLGSPACKEAPRDGILVRSPNHTEVTFTANGVQITIASTVILRAERNKTMDVLLVEGHARVTAPQGSQTLQPGQTVSVPLGGSTGLDPVSQPSVPVAFNPDSTLPIILVSTEKFSPAHASINVSVEGCITKAQGNTVTIQGQDIQFQSNDTVLRGAKVGDCVRVNGSLQADDQGKSVIIAVPNTASPPPVKPNVVQPSNNNAGDPGKSNPVNNAGGNGGGSGSGNDNPVSSAGSGSNSGGNSTGNGSNPVQVAGTPTPSAIVSPSPSGTDGAGVGGTAEPTTTVDTTNPGGNGSNTTPTTVGEQGSSGPDHTPVPATSSTTPPNPGTGKDGDDGKGGKDDKDKGDKKDGKDGKDKGDKKDDKGDKGDKGNADKKDSPHNYGNPGKGGNNPPGNSNPEPANNPPPVSNPVNSDPDGVVSTP